MTALDGTIRMNDGLENPAPPEPRAAAGERELHLNTEVNILLVARTSSGR
jgi:hypothetical protein